ncbi:alpha/beta hydrolase [Glutamicibacter sp. MNS18]|uniref:alpha/beta fold hydrolase n=1 Tax=Glutamicibacter sp. MNS18 TaxID=2989817 RepID=UPI0022365C80|nr:alpha/beta hydrolase [Glutamicibacter sp. MNS18]MCW4467201.1 alpha/beta hydrolase [Glutamicibacter sp. MNS18]
MSLDLNLRLIPANTEVSAPTVLLIHGFASSADLNWERSGWVRHFTDNGRNVALVDLPGHGEDPHRATGDWAPSRIREALAAGITELEHPVDVVGYSLGARLGWEFAAKHPELVRRLVIGGPGSLDPLAAFALNEARNFVSTGESIADEYTAKVMRIATNEKSNDFDALFKLIEGIKTEPYDPGEAIPAAPTLLVAGDQDDLATTMPHLRRLLTQAGTRSEVLWLAGRNHANAVTSRDFKSAALRFLDTE